MSLKINKTDQQYFPNQICGNVTKFDINIDSNFCYDAFVAYTIPTKQTTNSNFELLIKINPIDKIDLCEQYTGLCKLNVILIIDNDIIYNDNLLAIAKLTAHTDKSIKSFIADIVASEFEYWAFSCIKAPRQDCYGRMYFDFIEDKTN